MSGRPTPGNSAPGTACAARNVRDADAENSAATGPKAVRRKIPHCSVSRPRRPRETTRTSSVQSRPRGDRGQCFKALTPGSLPVPRGWGPRTALPQDSATGAASPGVPTRWACPVPREPGRLARWFGGKARRNPERIPDGLEMPTPGQQLRGTAARGRPEKSPNLPQSAGTAFPAPGLSESATPCPESAAASSRSRQRPQSAQEKKRTKQSCSVRLPDCYSAAFCAASARASASLARASASFRFAAASFSFASAS